MTLSSDENWRNTSVFAVLWTYFFSVWYFQYFAIDFTVNSFHWRKAYLNKYLSYIFHFETKSYFFTKLFKFDNIIIKQIKNWKMLVLSNFVGGGNKNNRKICKIIYFLQGKMIKKITEILVLENCM